MPNLAARIQTVGETAHDRILDMMLSGAFRPGETLQERRLAEILDMSRTPVREALQRLEIEGLIERVAGRCTMLTEPSVRDIVEVFNVRRVVEVEAAGLATDVFEVLQEQLEHLRQARCGSSCRATRSRSPDACGSVDRNRTRDRGRRAAARKSACDQRLRLSLR